MNPKKECRRAKHTHTHIACVVFAADEQTTVLMYLSEMRLGKIRSTTFLSFICLFCDKTSRGVDTEPIAATSKLVIIPSSVDNEVS
jgi:hypothetical protein